jgi:hypothetical protein
VFKIQLGATHVLSGGKRVAPNSIFASGDFAPLCRLTRKLNFETPDPVSAATPFPPEASDCAQTSYFAAGA